MNEKMPRTPFSTPLSGSARETELRIRNIFSGPKKRPPILLLVLMCAVCLLCGNLVSCQIAEPETDASAQPEPPRLSPAEPEDPEAEAERLSLQRAAEEKLEGYLWPRETIQKNIMGKEMEFVLYHGNGWTIHVPAFWEMNYYGAGGWQSPSQCAGFSVAKYPLGVNNPKLARAQAGSWRHETNYDPPFDYYYDNDGGYTPPDGSADYIYFFAPAGEKQSYEFTLQMVVGETSEEEKLIQEAMLLSFRLDDSSRVLNSEEYTPGKTEWEAAMAGLMAETEPIWFSWYHDGRAIDADGKGNPDYVSYVLELEEFHPEKFTEMIFGERPEGTEELDRDPITLCLPEMRIWLCFYKDSPWVYVSHVGEDYWAEFHHQNDSDKMIFDTVRAWLEAEQSLTGGNHYE